MLLLEEPESFLHPQATVDLFSLFSQMAHDEEKQIILTTHSPVLMELAGSSLSLVTRDDETGQSTIIRPPPAAQRALKRRGVMKSFMFAPLEPGFIPAGLIIVEGDDDVAVWSQWLAGAGLASKGVLVMTGGGGEGDAVGLALYMQHLHDSGIRAGPVLLVVDSDGDQQAKAASIASKGLREESYRVLAKKEIEDYLFDASAISEEFDIDVKSAGRKVSEAKQGKEGFNEIVASIRVDKGLPPGGADATIKGQVALRISPDQEIEDILNFFRSKI